METKEQKNEEFEKIRDKMRFFLSEKKLLSILRNRIDVSESTVSKTFQVKNKSELVGKKFEVWNTAIQIIEEYKTLENRANKALE